MSATDITTAMLADFNSMKGGSVFDATQVDSLDNVASERNPVGKGHNLRSVRDPIGYTRATPDPEHHGQAMRSPMRTAWIKSQGLETQGLWSRGVFQKVLRTSLTPQDKVFSTRFHYKIKRKGGEFDKCKVRLVVQGQHMKRKGAVGVGDYMTLLARCLLLAVSALFLVLPPNSTCLLIMSTFLRPLYKVNYYPGTATMELYFISTGI